MLLGPLLFEMICVEWGYVGCYFVSMYVLAAGCNTNGPSGIIKNILNLDQNLLPGFLSIFKNCCQRDYLTF